MPSSESRQFLNCTCCMLSYTKQQAETEKFWIPCWSLEVLMTRSIKSFMCFVLCQNYLDGQCILIVKMWKKTRCWECVFTLKVINGPLPNCIYHQWPQAPHVQWNYWWEISHIWHYFQNLLKHICTNSKKNIGCKLEQVSPIQDAMHKRRQHTFLAKPRPPPTSGSKRPEWDNSSIKLTTLQQT